MVLCFAYSKGIYGDVQLPIPEGETMFESIKGEEVPQVVRREPLLLEAEQLTNHSALSPYKGRY